MKLTVFLGVVLALAYPGVANAQSNTVESPDLIKSREITSTVIKLFEAGKYDEALPLAKQALELREHALGAQHQDLIPLLTNLAEINNSLQRLEDSEAFFNRALKITETSYGNEDLRIAAILDRLAYVEHALRHDGIVENALVRSLRVKEKALGPNDLEIAQTAYNLAELYRSRTDYKKAAPLYQRAVKIREQAGEKDHAKLIKALEGYVFVLTGLKRNEEASQVQHRIAQLSVERAIIDGGVLNGKALALIQPNYPMRALEEHASGMVSVRVLIDENGNVISAKAENANKAHPSLVSAAEAAARKSRFSPTFVDGVAVRVRGIIIYNFVGR